MNLYIAYGVASDQTTALRLQALGAVNGLNVYVPPSYTRTDVMPSMDPQSESRLSGADVVLGIITSAMHESCRQELNLAKALGRKTIVMVEPAISPRWNGFFQATF